LFIVFLGFRFSLLSFLGLDRVLHDSGGMVLLSHSGQSLRAPLPLVHSVGFSMLVYPVLLGRLIV
jgi:hypothetical protein